MLAAIKTGVSWRAQLFRGKLAGNLSQVPWPLIWDEVTQRRELAWDPPAIKVLDRDETAGLHLLDVAGEALWFPPEATPHILEGLYKVTYYPPHPHHFEFKNCRIQRDDVVVDAGSFEGFFTRFALDRGARVIAVEPWSKMADALRRNFSREIAEGRVQVAQTVLSDRRGSTKLVIDPDYPVAASVYHDDAQGLVSEQVRETTLDALIEDSGWDRCDFVKMDIEGSERGAVVGGTKVLQRWRPRLSIAVYHAPNTYVEIAEDLQKLRLDYRVSGKGLVYGLDQIWRPLMLHAWPSSPARG